MECDLFAYNLFSTPRAALAMTQEGHGRLLGNDLRHFGLTVQVRVQTFQTA